MVAPDSMELFGELRPGRDSKSGTTRADQSRASDARLPGSGRAIQPSRSASTR
jgi:hypothetical protein